MAFITTGSGSGGIAGPVTSTTNSIALFADTTGDSLKEALHLTITDGGDRAKITTGAAGTLEIHRAALGASNYLYLADRQVSLIGQNLYFEQNNTGLGFGDIWWETHDTSYIGYSRREGTYNGPKEIWLGSALKFDKNGDGTPQSTITGLGSGVLDTRSNGSILYDLSGTYYVETYPNFAGLHLWQTNLTMRINTVNAAAASGLLILANENGASNGPRLFTATLAGTTTNISNNTLTANTVAFITVSSPSNQGFHSFSVSGTTLTITSSNASDASVVKIFLVENG